MKIHIQQVSLKYYNSHKWNQVKYWFFYFRKFRFICGATIRIFGITCTITESNALLKLIKTSILSGMSM